VISRPLADSAKSDTANPVRLPAAIETIHSRPKNAVLPHKVHKAKKPKRKKRPAAARRNAAAEAPATAQQQQTPAENPAPAEAPVQNNSPQKSKPKSPSSTNDGAGEFDLK
jgi:hypothetical protein